MRLCAGERAQEVDAVRWRRAKCLGRGQHVESSERGAHEDPASLLLVILPVPARSQQGKCNQRGATGNRQQPWPIYSQSNDLFQRPKQMVNVWTCLWLNSLEGLMRSLGGSYVIVVRQLVIDCYVWPLYVHVGVVCEAPLWWLRLCYGAIDTSRNAAIFLSKFKKSLASRQIVKILHLFA